jgi:hypothetical protein
VLSEPEQDEAGGSSYGYPASFQASMSMGKLYEIFGRDTSFAGVYTEWSIIPAKQRRISFWL